MDVREAVSVLLAQADRCRCGSDLHRAFHGAEEFEANEVLVAYFLEATKLEFDLQEFLAKFGKPGAPPVSGLIESLKAAMELYAQLATEGTAKGVAKAAAARKGG